MKEDVKDILVLVGIVVGSCLLFKVLDLGVSKMVGWAPYEKTPPVVFNTSGKIQKPAVALNPNGILEIDINAAYQMMKSQEVDSKKNSKKK